MVLEPAVTGTTTFTMVPVLRENESDLLLQREVASAPNLH